MNNPLMFSHLGYIATAYALFGTTVIYIAISTQLRIASVARRLRAADPRERTPDPRKRMQ